MSDEYKKLIIERIRDGVNRWIDELKGKHPELLLTKQWRILFPKGFIAGHNSIPVVTHSKEGQHQVAEIQFVLPNDLNLDIEDIQLVMKDEGYEEAQASSEGVKLRSTPVPVDEPLDMLNRIVLGINEFISSLGTRPMPSGNIQPKANPLNGTAIMLGNSPVRVLGSENSDLEDLKRRMINSALLPEWIKSIESRATYDEVISKLAIAYQQYQKQTMGRSDMGEFFAKYTAHLLNAGHLHHYCTYKGKPVELNDRGHCQESYCSKKPFNDKCNVPKLRFGGVPNNL